jgi:hypothetical protein
MGPGAYERKLAAAAEDVCTEAPRYGATRLMGFKDTLIIKKSVP